MHYNQQLMKRTFFNILLLTSSYVALSQGVTSENKELPRSSFMSYRSAQQALEDDIAKSNNYLSLSGEWLFGAATDVSKIAMPGGELPGMQKIVIPAAAELNGFSQAIYSAKAYPFLKSAPQKVFKVGNTKSELFFVRDFSIPFDYTDRALFLHIGAANSAVTLYINGEKVGYSTDSRNPAEFDISKFIVQGRNRIVLSVDRYCEGSFLEDQSQWRLMGLNRHVYIFAQPKIRVRDFLVRTTLDPTFKNGMLETALLLKTQLLNTHKVTVYYDLFDPNGELVNQNSKEIEVGLRGEDTVRFSATILNVKQWNAETPNLYTIAYRIQREGRFTEYVTLKAGFRTVEIANGKLLINGKEPKIKGVNYAEFSPTLGNVLTRDEMLESITQMKFAGINAIRTDGYPLPADFYDICDLMGIYVCDVANINAQGIGTSTSKGETLANDPAWLNDFLYRVNNTYERNKSHTSVIMWALGDNAGNGYNMYEAFLMLKAKESSRPITYNGASLAFNSEIFCPDFMTSPELTKIVPTMSRQPIIFSRCPFDAEIWESPMVQGGFIERWAEPSITSHAKFAELSDNYKLTERSNGTVSLPSAQKQLDQIRDCFVSVGVRQIDSKTYEFENRLDYANLNEMKIIFQSFKNGKEIFHGQINVDAAPGAISKTILPNKIVKSCDHTIITVGNIAKYEFKK